MKKATPMEIETNSLSARSILRVELQKRISTRPQYSLRAFAKALGISPATLSLILSEKIKVSKRVINKMIQTIELTQEQIKFLKSNSAQSIESDRIATQELREDTFLVLSEWYYIAILSLTELSDFSMEPRWISKKLGITVSEASTALARLQRVGLIGQVEGKWQQLGGHLRAPATLSTVAARRIQRQILEKAINSLEQDPAEKRDITCMTFAVDAKHLSYASERISEFRRALVNELELKGNSSSVYNLTIQLYPLTKE